MADERLSAQQVAELLKAHDGPLFAPMTQAELVHMVRIGDGEDRTPHIKGILRRLARELLSLRAALAQAEQERDTYAEWAAINAKQTDTAEARSLSHADWDAVRALVEAAQTWWEGYRPLQYSPQDHRHNPTVNIATDSGKALAMALPAVVALLDKKGKHG